jgi:hypothetical protein
VRPVFFGLRYPLPTVPPYRTTGGVGAGCAVLNP